MKSLQPAAPRMLTLAELAALIKGYRKLKQWTPDELAERAEISILSLQAVENEQSNDPDTLRALSTAFGFSDVDAFNKPIHIPTAQDFEKEEQSSESQGIALEAFVLSTGQELAELVLNSSALAVSRAFEMDMQADKVFEALTDYAREYREYFEEYSETKIHAVHQEFQEYLEELKQLDVSISFATREIANDDAQSNEVNPSPGIALYLVAFPRGEEPDSFLV